MSDNLAHYPCKLCGNPEGEQFFYYTARKVNTSYSVKPGMYGNDTIRTTTYTDVTKHAGFICKNCRNNKKRWREFIINMHIFVTCVAILAVAGNSLLNKYGFVVFILGLATFVSGCGMIGSFKKKSGSELLIDYYKKQENPNKYTYLTPSEALKLQRKK